MNLFVFFIFFLIVLISCYSYGFFFYSYFRKNLNLDVEYCLLLSLLFLCLLSYLTHFFIPHNYFHNSIIFIIGIILFIYYYITNQKNFLKELKLIIFLSIILSIALIIFKTHDDFPYYHFPYTYYLTQENIIFGIGSINHGFRTTSSIFYLNSIFYLPIIEFFSFQFGAILFYLSAVYIFLIQIQKDFQNKIFDFIFYLKLFSLAFILIFFYRISEHGTDRTAQIFIFLLFIELFSLFRKNSKFNEFISKFFILLALIISLKSFYILYLLSVIPIYFFIKKKNLMNSFKLLLKNLSFQFFIVLFFLVLLVNLSNSGCLIYPVSFTCFPFLDWSLGNEASYMNNWYELWSKGGANPNIRVENSDEYIKGFNWVLNWMDGYFFNKVSDFLLGLIFLIILFHLIFKSKLKKKISIRNHIILTLIILLILFFEWFYNHPSLRYGGYSVIALLLFIPSSINLSRNIKTKNFKNKISFFVIISMIIFFGRNIDRVINENKKYNYKPIIDAKYRLDNNHFRIDKYLNDKKKVLFECKMNKILNCNFSDTITMYKKNKYYFLKKND
jgi:hypothetical protein